MGDFFPITHYTPAPRAKCRRRKKKWASGAFDAHKLTTFITADDGAPRHGGTT